MTLYRPLACDPWFRAGVLGLPFCIVMGYFRREPIFLLGGGFFASFVVSSLYIAWKVRRNHNESADTSTTADR